MSIHPDPGSSPQRIISLVPSITDSLITLGFAQFLVGVTDYCILPDSLKAIPRVGGIKDSRFSDILALNPDLVLANREENAPKLIKELEDAEKKVWVTFPKTVREALADLRDIAFLYASEKALQSVVWLERAVSWLESSQQGTIVRVFCPIWREGTAEAPQGWITFNHDTYAENLLTLCGGENVFSEKTESRYPRITPSELEFASPDLILLPNEPFAFSEADSLGLAALFPKLPVVLNGRINCLDGRLLFWHGTRLGESIRILPEILIQPGISRSTG